MAHPFGNDPAKIARYQRFWDLAPVDRPLIGFSLMGWFPFQQFSACKNWREQDLLAPQMIDPKEFVEDQERLLREGERLGDDIIRGACPTEGIVWLSSMLGVPLRILQESTMPESVCLAFEDIRDLTLDQDNPWFRKYIEFTDVLVAASSGRYPVSHCVLHGPADLASELRGYGQMVLDMYDSPGEIARLLDQMRGFFRQVLDAQWQHIPTWHGGYFDSQYQLWAPGPIIRMQEDASALLSPDLYREFLQPVDRKLASSYEYSFMHLHSTSMFLLDDFLDIEEIRCFEINRDVIGPPLRDMLPYYKQVQNSGRPLLIRGSFCPSEFGEILDNLRPEGLYLYVMVESMEEAAKLRDVVGM